MQIKSKISVGVLIGVVGLSGCKSKNETIDLKSFDDQSYFQSLKKEAYKSKTSSQTDIEALSALLPETVNLTYDAVSYSDKSGATTLSNVNLTVTDSELGVNIESLSLWDVNESALTERLSGQNLKQEFSLFGRVEADNLSVTGLEAAFEPLLDASNDLNKKLLENSVGGGSELTESLMKQSIDKYEISLKNFIATDVKIHPWIINLTQAPFGEEDEDKTEANKVWHSLQKMAAWSHVISYKDMAAYDGVFDIAMSQGETPISFDMDVGLLAYKGYERGDMEYGVVRDFEYVMDMATPIEDGTKTQSIKTTTSADSYAYEGIQLAQIMKHLAIGEMPDRKKTDLMSLGVWTGENTQVSIDDQKLYSLDHYKLDMSEFHGLVPEIFDLKIENAKYNVEGFSSWLKTVGSDLQMDTNEVAEMQEMLTKVTEVLKKHDMAEPSVDLDFAMHWDGETGVSDFGYKFGIDDIGHFKSHYDGIMPAYDSAIELLPKDLKDFDGDGFDKLFEDTAAFKSLSYEVSDDGFDTLYGLIIDLSKLAPTDQQNPMLKNATPNQIRQLMAGGVTMSGAMMAQQFPPAQEHVETIANFLAKGGVLNLDLEANSPVYLKEIDESSGQIFTDPDKFQETFKLDVTHTGGSEKE